MRKSVATREGGVDRNAANRGTARDGCESPPVRVAWIEIKIPVCLNPSTCVATREGGVDRNKNGSVIEFGYCVATREGGVDRNKKEGWHGRPLVVATREGGVDRNFVQGEQSMLRESRHP